MQPAIIGVQRGSASLQRARGGRQRRPLVLTPCTLKEEFTYTLPSMQKGKALPSLFAYTLSVSRKYLSVDLNTLHKGVQNSLCTGFCIGYGFHG